MRGRKDWLGSEKGKGRDERMKEEKEGRKKGRMDEG